MTIIWNEFLYWLIVVLVVVLFVFIGSYILSSVLKKLMKPSSKWVEVISSALLMITVIALYFVFEEQFTLKANQGDLLVTENGSRSIEEESGRIISTENPMVIYHLYMLGFNDTLDLGSDPGLDHQILISTNDYQALYPYVEEGRYHLNDGAFHFTKYYEEMISPVAQEMLKQLREAGLAGEELEAEFLKIMEDQFPYHHFHSSSSL
ncbi:hypothetical protein BTS2_0919 [Bacillus sp. TS-2]|nr:hypothetical protein BTS2_0919 [Bacillus sp. TS-2]